MTPDNLHRYLFIQSLKLDDFAAALGQTPDAIKAWTSPPDYVRLTVIAIKNRKQPATEQRMMETDLVKVLGVQPATADRWQKTRQFPLSARYAIAATNRVKSSYIYKPDARVLRNIDMGRYYRRGSWFALPVLGKPLPSIKHQTMTKLIDNGFVVMGKRRPLLTDKGKRIAYHAKISDI